MQKPRDVKIKKEISASDITTCRTDDKVQIFRTFIQCHNSDGDNKSNDNKGPVERRARNGLGFSAKVRRITFTGFPDENGFRLAKRAKEY